MYYPRSKQEIEQEVIFKQLIKEAKKIPGIKKITGTLIELLASILGVPIPVILGLKYTVSYAHKYGIEIPKEIKEKYKALETSKKVISFSVKETHRKLEEDCDDYEASNFNKYYCNWRVELEDLKKIISYLVKQEHLEVFRIPGTNSYQINLHLFSKMQNEGHDIEYFLNNIQDPFLVELDKKHMIDKYIERIKNDFYQ